VLNQLACAFIADALVGWEGVAQEALDSPEN
jgi:hypothetical protein